MNASSSRLGERLVSEGKLGPDQVQRALDNQQLVGGRLGTNLLALDLLGEESLLETLGRLRSTPTASAADLGRISSAVLRSIPEKLARRYRLVPYQVRGKTLMVASMDPGDVLREDEISFLTGFMVRTCVALELRVHIALRQHYEVPLNPRLLPIARRLLRGGRSPSPSVPFPAVPSVPSGPSALPVSSKDPAPSPSPSSSSPAAPAPPMAPAAEPTLEFIELDADDLAALRAPAASPSPGPEMAAASAMPPSSSGMPTPPPGPTSNESGEGAMDDLVFEAHEEDSTLEGRLDRAAQALMGAEIRDDIGEALLGFTGHYFRRRLLLVARKGELVGWMGAGEGMVEERVRAIRLDGRAPSVFVGLLQTSSFWLGPLPPLSANQRVIEGLGGVAPRDCLALPVILRSKVVGHLYVDNLEKGVAGAPVAELKRLAGMAGLAFEVYILKNKIRSFGAAGREGQA